MNGAGFQPAGTSAAGLGTPLGLPTPGAGYESSADACAVRAISAVTRDYVIDATTTGLAHVATTAAQQKVLLALTTPLGQITAVPGFGDDTLNMKRMTTIEGVRAFTESALLALTDAGEIAIDNIEIENEHGALVRVVSWTDTTLSTSHETRF